ncbi:hypothetical protein LCGC14_2999070 [marine sediment metagenome]|uniref:Uncharacterized protein n=1 Tax=marine sediment metagenome TaxID=412755 RepID=A0A0F8XP70_9ZZZZ
MGNKEKQFEKVVKGWSMVDYFFFSIYLISLILSIYFTINLNPYFVFLSLLFMVACMIGLYVFLEREVYWRELK